MAGGVAEAGFILYTWCGVGFSAMPASRSAVLFLTYFSGCTGLRVCGTAGFSTVHLLLFTISCQLPVTAVSTMLLPYI